MAGSAFPRRINRGRRGSAEPADDQQKQGSNDWFSGAGGASCGHAYLCVAKKGYDAPTGLGGPGAIGAF